MIVPVQKITELDRSRDAIQTCLFLKKYGMVGYGRNKQPNYNGYLLLIIIILFVCNILQLIFK